MLYITSKQISFPSACQKCGQRRTLIPCASKELDRIEENLLHLSDMPAITYLCETCRLEALEEMDELPVQYEHPWVPPGTYGLVSPKIRKVLPSCPWAGKIVRTCEGYYFPLTWLETHHMNLNPMKVPVRLRAWTADHPPFSIELDYLLLFEQAPGDSLTTVFTKVPFFSSP